MLQMGFEGSITDFLDLYACVALLEARLWCR